MQLPKIHVSRKLGIFCRRIESLEDIDEKKKVTVDINNDLQLNATFGTPQYLILSSGEELIHKEIISKGFEGLTASTNQGKNTINKIATFLSEQTGVKITFDSAKPKFEEALTALKEDIYEYKDNKDDIDNQQREEEEQKLLEKATANAVDFKMLLKTNDCTLTQYIENRTKWVSGAEYKNVMIGTLCTASTILKIKPLWFIITGKAGEGKTFIEEGTKHFIPVHKIENGLKTEKALIRNALKRGENYIDGQILIMGDLGSQRDFDKWYDTLHKYKKLSEDGYDDFEAVGEGIDQDTGERNILVLRLQGYPGVCFTSVNSEKIDDQFSSRGISVTPTSTDKEASKMLHYLKPGMKYTTIRNQIINEELELYHGYLESLGVENQIVINPYDYCLEEWFKDTDWFKRGLSIYPSLVNAHTLLNSDFREKIVDEETGQVYVISSLEDNQVISDLFEPSQRVSGDAKNVFNKLTELYTYFDEEQYKEYTGGDIRIGDCKTFFSANSARTLIRNNKKFRGLPIADILQSLEKAGLLEIIGKVNRSNHNIYILKETEALEYTKIKFRKECIDNWFSDHQDSYIIDLEQVRKIVVKDKIIEHENTLELPPWG